VSAIEGLVKTMVEWVVAWDRERRPTWRTRKLSMRIVVLPVQQPPRRDENG
jgi:hypothetical protein